MQHVKCESLLLVPTKEMAWNDVRIEELGDLAVVIEDKKQVSVLMSIASSGPRLQTSNHPSSSGP